MFRVSRNAFHIDSLTSFETISFFFNTICDFLKIINLLWNPTIFFHCNLNDYCYSSDRKNERRNMNDLKMLKNWFEFRWINTTMASRNAILMFIICRNCNKDKCFHCASKAAMMVKQTFSQWMNALTYKVEQELRVMIRKFLAFRSLSFIAFEIHKSKFLILRFSSTRYPWDEHNTIKKFNQLTIKSKIIPFDSLTNFLLHVKCSCSVIFQWKINFAKKEKKKKKKRRKKNSIS